MMDAPASTSAERGTRLALTVTRAARAVAAHLEPTLRAEGLTLDQWLTLDALARGQGATMTELATLTRLPGPTLTRVVDRLVMLAAVYREVDAADRRRVRVYLSSRGQALHGQLAGRLTELERALLDRAELPVELVDALDRL